MKHTLVRRILGQTSSELMMVISVICVGVTGASYAFVPQFQSGVNILGANVQTMLSTGSFAGLGLANVGNGDVPLGDQGAAGGEGDAVQTPRPGGGNPWFSGFGWGRSFNYDAWLVNFQTMMNDWRLANQGAGQAPPTGIPGFVCGQWGLSDAATRLGSDATMKQFIDAAKAFGWTTATDGRLTARQVATLARLAGMYARMNRETQNFGAASNWMANELKNGRVPMIMIKGPDGSPHWIEVSNVQYDADGRLVGVTYRDANSTEPQTMNAQDLDRAWSAQGFDGVTLGKGSGVNLLAGFENK